MSNLILILYSRKGCCLCEGLEKRLRGISLEDIYPFLSFIVIDIDTDFISVHEKASLDLRVPVLALSIKEKDQTIEMPRVSPRIKEKELFFWMKKNINKLIN